MNKGNNKVPYIAMPHVNRFWGLHSEQCYTDNELNFREFVIKTRANSGIHPDFLNNPSTWFSENNIALLNPYEHSWFLSNAFKPRHMPSIEEFYVQPINSQRLEIPALYDLMQQVGDYLILRNELLPLDQLNQPVNFILMDVNLILKHLSQNPNIHQVKEQLGFLTNYLGNIETQISPIVGSDRLFFANFRYTIDKDIHPILSYEIESQLLQTQLGDLNKAIKRLSSYQQRILHFALNTNKVNSHSHEFSLTQYEDTKSFPVSAATKCAENSKELTIHPMQELKLTGEQLKNCQGFKLISMEPDILDLYSKGVIDLYEINRFQTMIKQVIKLLGQAGEVYTVLQFKVQLITLLKQIDIFVDDSSKNIENLINENTQAYHKAIRDEQKMPFLERWLTSNKKTLDAFIKNHDSLTHFPSSTTELQQTNTKLKNLISGVVTHLSQTKSKTIRIEELSKQTQELNEIMNSMHLLIKTQQDRKGIKPPPLPEFLDPVLTIKEDKIPPQKIQSAFFFTPPPIKSSQPKYETLPSRDKSYKLTGVSSEAISLHLVFGLIGLGALGALMVYSLMFAQASTQPIQKTREKCDELKTQADNLIIEIKQAGDLDTIETINYNDIIEEYKSLTRKANKGIYKTPQWSELVEELQFFKKSITEPITLMY